MYLHISESLEAFRFSPSPPPHPYGLQALGADWPEGPSNNALFLLPPGGCPQPLQPEDGGSSEAPVQPPAADPEAVAPSPSLGTRERAKEEDVKQGKFRSPCLTLTSEGCPGEGGEPKTKRPGCGLRPQKDTQ